MAYGLDMDGEVRRRIQHLPPERKRAVREACRAIAADPNVGKPLVEELAGLRSYRVRTWRLVYVVDEAERMIHVVALGPRRDIYEELSRERRRR